MLKQSTVNDLDEALSRAQLAQIWAERAYKLAQEPQEEKLGETLNLLVFRLGQERYGIEVLNVREIYPLEQLTRLPRTPNFVAGVFSARGRILSIIDLHAFLGLSAGEYDKHSFIIVAHNTNPLSDTADMEVGILANEVEDVRTILYDQVDTSLIARNTTDYTMGVTDDLLEVLDLNALLEDSRLIINDEL